jgi:hypothetical protein
VRYTVHPPPPPEPRTLPERLARQAALTGRYALEGLAGIGDPINMALQGLGVPIERAGAVTARRLTEGGVPEPETGTERVVGDVSRALTQAMTSAGGAASAAARELPALATSARDRVIDLLAKRFGLQASSATGAGAAGGVARESGLDPISQLAASLVGGLAAPGVAYATVPRVDPSSLAIRSPQAFSDIWRLGREAVRPVRGGPSGQERVAGAILNRYAADPRAASEALARAKELVPGSAPTAAEASGDIGLASFQRALANLPGVGTALAQHQDAQNAARLAALRRISGSPGELEAAKQARSAQSDIDYTRMRTTPPDISPESAQKLASFHDLPAFQEAWKAAEREAANRRMTPEQMNLETPAFMHLIKEALGDQISKLQRSGEKAAARNIVQMKNDFTDVLNEVSVHSRAADANYRASSRVIDKMEALQDLERSAQVAAPTLGGDPRLSQAAFKRDLPKALEQVSDPLESASLDAILADLNRSAGAAVAGKALGSNTTQNLASLNALASTFGSAVKNPVEGFLGSAFSTPVGKLYQWSGVEGAIEELLQRALLDPQFAARLMREAPMSRASQTLAQIFAEGHKPLTAGTAAGLPSPTREP